MNKFNINRPRRRSFDSWVEDMRKLSGAIDLTQMGHRMEQELMKKDPAREYAEAEMAEGRWREDHPNDETEA